MSLTVTAAMLDMARVFAADVVAQIHDELNAANAADQTVWVAVDDFGDGVPAGGPFDSYEECAAWIDCEEHLEPREMPAAEALAGLAETRRLANEKYQQWLKENR